MKLSEQDKKNIWHPFTPLAGAEAPILIESGEGVFLNTSEGRKIIDAISSWWVNLHGHSHPYIAEAVSLQAKKLEHVIFAGFTHEPAIRLAGNLLNILPANHSKIFFSDNGSTAVEVALKMAFQHWYNLGIDRKKIIALEGAYHGDTFGSMAVGERGIFTRAFSSYLFEANFVEFPRPGHEEKTLAQFQSLIDKHDVGAFIFEPLVQAAAGMRIYHADILDSMIAYAQKHDVICIADEVFTGFGRTGKYFASDYLKKKPDIIALSKGLTGGFLPLGVTSCTSNVVSAFESEDVLKTFFHGHSYTANPLSCSAANASYELLIRSECATRIGEIEKRHIEFKQKLTDHRNVTDVRSLGTVLAIELKTESETGYTNTARKKIYQYFLEKNILLRPLGNVIYVLPPYIITDDQLNRIYNAIEEFLDSLK